MFLANENFPAPSIKLICDSNCKVLSIQETTPGISGQQPLFAGEILLKALNEGLLDFKQKFTVFEAENIRQRYYFK